MLKENPKLARHRVSAYYHLIHYLMPPEMEFLDTNFTKDSSLLLDAFHSPFYWRILKKTIRYSSLVLKNRCKNP
jgi:hypothetical protein